MTRLRFCAAFALAISLFGAGAPSSKPQAPKTLRVPVAVPAPGSDASLGPADFQAVLEARDKARILQVQSPKDDMVLFVILDMVGDLAFVDPARAALIESLRKLPQNIHVAVLRAQDGLHVMEDPTGDRDALAAAIQSAPVSGKAGLLDTVETAVRVADAVTQRATVRAAVLYVTDSDVRNYREDFSNPVINSSDSRDLSRRFPEGLIREKVAKLQDRLVQFQTPVFFVHLSYSSERLNEAYQSGLMQIASATGGSGIYCRSASDIPGAISKMVADIANQYTVVVQLPAKVPRVLNVSVTSGDLPVTTRTRYLIR